MVVPSLVSVPPGAARRRKRFPHRRIERAKSLPPVGPHHIEGLKSSCLTSCGVSRGEAACRHDQLVFTAAASHGISRPFGRPKVGRPRRPMSAPALASGIKQDEIDDGISDAASMGDETCVEVRVLELQGVLFYVNQVRHQQQLRRRTVTKDLWALYLILRHPCIHQRCPSAAFRGVAVCLERHIHDVRESHDPSVEESPLDTLRNLFRTSLTKSGQTSSLA